MGGASVDGRGYFVQLTASSSRLIWQSTQSPQKVDTHQSLQIEPFIPSISLTLVRSATRPPGRQQGTQKCSPTRFDITPAQHRLQNRTPKQFWQSSVHPNSAACHSLFPVVTCVVVPPPPRDDDVTWRVTTVVEECAILGLSWKKQERYQAGYANQE